MATIKSNFDSDMDIIIVYYLETLFIHNIVGIREFMNASV